jgi:hypothetical protein
MLSSSRSRRSKAVTVSSALQTIFKYLQLPKTNFDQLNSTLGANKISFCSSCFEIVDDVMMMQEKVIVLELMIQNKVEALGKVVAKTPSNKISRRWGVNKASIIWKNFRNPVIQSKTIR